MKYLINRASDWACEQSPCNNARLVKSVMSPKYEDSDEYWCENYYDIELDGLDDLERLIDEVGDVTIRKNWGDDLGYDYEILINDN